MSVDLRNASAHVDDACTPTLSLTMVLSKPRWAILTREYVKYLQLEWIPLVLTQGQLWILDLEPGGFITGVKFEEHYYALTHYGWEHVPSCRACQGLD